MAKKHKNKKAKAQALNVQEVKAEETVALAQTTSEPQPSINVPSNALRKQSPKVRKKIQAVEEATVEEKQEPTIKEAQAPAITKKKRKAKLSLTGKKALSGWLFCLPFVLGILGIYLPIVFKSIEVGFHGPMGNDPAFTLNAYKAVFIDMKGDFVFLDTVKDAVRDLIIQIPAIVIFSLFMAIILNQKMTGRAFFRAIFFLPVILSTGIIDAIDADIHAGDVADGSTMDEGAGEAASSGLVSTLDIEMLLSSVNLKFTLGNTTIDLVKIVTDLVNDIFNIVSRSGVQMLIFLSGLQSISPSIYESCQVEGASAWETFWKITLPMISPMILVNAIYTVVDLLTAADNRVMEGLGGYGGMFGDKNPGNFSAGIWVYTAIALLIIVVVALILRTVVFYQRKD